MLKNGNTERTERTELAQSFTEILDKYKYLLFSLCVSMNSLCISV